MICKSFNVIFVHSILFDLAQVQPPLNRIHPEGRTIIGVAIVIIMQSFLHPVSQLVSQKENRFIFN